MINRRVRFWVFSSSCKHRVTPFFFRFAFFLTVAVSLTGCFSSGGYVPVSSAGERAKGQARYHVVQRGDTLYSIAFRYGLDYSEIASANDIAPPYTIYINQRLVLSGEAQRKATGRQKNVTKKASKPSVRPAVPKSQASDLSWRWPVKGEVIKRFSLTGDVNKGVDIRGKLGESVLAAADGTVVYAGGGLRGYGKLVILKHNDSFLSAYGHNRVILVKEGEKVKGGQVVAEIGSSGPGQEMLHFEIRRDGKPEDPLIYLPR
ncbi:MAG: peptidoglycan DD-metalloendopeptidase family protein [Pseudomonadales bacterium]|nr:peptidoglycan DD-metalloendopeptidase family protein [Pseudomonadales bacterium]